MNVTCHAERATVQVFQPLTVNGTASDGDDREEL